MDRVDTSCLVESKKEYTNLLIRKIKTPILNVIMNCFADVKNNCSHTRDEEKLLVYFQDYLEKIPEWQNNKIEEVTQDIISQSKCDYLEDMLFAVFILHTRIFDAIEPIPENGSSKNKIVFPNLSNFIFKALVNVAREHWKYVYLFKEAINSCEYQMNRNKCEEIIERSILDTVTEILPVRDILYEHIHKYSISEDKNEEEDKEDDDELLKQFMQIQKFNKMKRKTVKKGQSGGFFKDDDTNSIDDIALDDVLENSRMKQPITSNTDTPDDGLSLLSNNQPLNSVAPGTTGAWVASPVGPYVPPQIPASSLVPQPETAAVPCMSLSQPKPMATPQEIATAPVSAVTSGFQNGGAPIISEPIDLDKIGTHVNIGGNEQKTIHFSPLPSPPNQEISVDELNGLEQISYE
tara:strand:+ start:3894 stop:5114 length:1221 start_codon:yes stop_codon:yes gene_type:complete